MSERNDYFGQENAFRVSMARLFTWATVAFVFIIAASAVTCEGHKRILLGRMVDKGINPIVAHCGVYGQDNNAQNAVICAAALKGTQP